MPCVRCVLGSHQERTRGDKSATSCNIPTKMRLYPSPSLCLRLSACLSVCLSVSLSVCPPARLPARLSVSHISGRRFSVRRTPCMGRRAVRVRATRNTGLSAPGSNATPGGTTVASPVKPARNKRPQHKIRQIHTFTKSLHCLGWRRCEGNCGQQHTAIGCSVNQSQR